MKHDFNNLTNNAIKYLIKSLDEFGHDQQFSTINFFTSLELILKARLFSEHWTLIVEDIKNVSKDRFEKGDFKSVSLKDAHVRLVNIINDGFHKHDFEIFEEIGKERNKMIHFYSRTSTEDTAALICKGWLILSRKISGRWKDCFFDFLPEFNKISNKMSTIQAFLSAKYSELKTQIDGKIKGGADFIQCPSCKYLSMEKQREIGELFLVSCCVCNVHSKVLFFQCSDCGGDVLVEEDFNGKCTKCETIVNEEILYEKFGEHLSHRDISRGAMSREAYCTECWNMENYTVVPFHDKYLCIKCFVVTDAVDQCEFCGEAWNCAQEEDSFWSGCEMCGGKSRWIMNE